LFAREIEEYTKGNLEKNSGDRDEVSRLGMEWPRKLLRIDMNGASILYQHPPQHKLQSGPLQLSQKQNQAKKSSKKRKVQIKIF